MLTPTKFKEESGLTLVEVLVSLLLFGVAFGGLMFLLKTILVNADDLRNNTIAAGLAQEGLETVRGIRDQDWIASRSFGYSIPDGKWEVQWDSDALMADSSRYLKKDATTGRFSYSSGTDTRFKRTIEIMTVNPYEKIASVSISWRTNNTGQRSLQAESHLYNWY